jgi:K+ transport systems, NAD-binding component
VRQRWDVHDGALILLGIKLRAQAEILNQPLKDLCGPDDPYHIVAIKRGGDTIIPSGLDELRVGDLAYFMTTKEYIPYIRKIVGKEHYTDVKNVIMMGGGKTTVRAALTVPDYMNVKIIEKDAKRCERLNELLENKDTMVIHGDGRDLGLLEEEGIRNTQAFVALTENAETNILACLTAKKMGVGKSIVEVGDVEQVTMAQNLNIGSTVNKKSLTAASIYQILLDSDKTNAKCFSLIDAEVVDLTAQNNASITLKPVMELRLPKGITLGGLVRNGVGQTVTGQTHIQPGDQVVVICPNESIAAVQELFTK